MAAQQERFNEFLDPSRSVPDRVNAAREAPAFKSDDALARSKAMVQDTGEDLALRVAALEVAGSAVNQDADVFGLLLQTVTDTGAPIELRRTALFQLDMAAVTSPLPAIRRAEWLSALRSLLDEEDKTLRHRALETLAMEKDEEAQRRLIETMQSRSNALIGVASAIQMLGYDVHADHFPLLREIVRNPPSKAARQEALRLLAGDPNSAELLTQIFEDKNEETEARRLSAIALQAIAPQQFEARAMQVIEDDDEDDALRASCTTALAIHGDPALIANTPKLQEKVRWLYGNAASRPLRQAASQFITRYGP